MYFPAAIRCIFFRVSDKQCTSSSYQQPSTCWLIPNSKTTGKETTPWFHIGLYFRNRAQISKGMTQSNFQIVPIFNREDPIDRYGYPKVGKACPGWIIGNSDLRACFKVRTVRQYSFKIQGVITSTSTQFKLKAV